MQYLEIKILTPVHVQGLYEYNVSCVTRVKLVMWMGNKKIAWTYFSLEIEMFILNSIKQQASFMLFCYFHDKNIFRDTVPL
jgi:hypothetical protein